LRRPLLIAALLAAACTPPPPEPRPVAATPAPAASPAPPRPAPVASRPTRPGETPAQAASRELNAELGQGPTDAGRWAPERGGDPFDIGGMGQLPTLPQ
jgi:hypothetical protein